MTTTTTTARVYVACLASYNNGTLYGKWIDADDDIDGKVQAMLDKSPTPYAEEWAIHDYEGFHGIRLSESESFDDVSALAEAIDEHGEAFALFYDNISCDSIGDAITQFGDAYSGCYDSERDYAEQYVNDCYNLDDMGDLANHIDYDSVAREHFINGRWNARGDDGLHVFRNL
jgi:antirestriction protein